MADETGGEQGETHPAKQFKDREHGSFEMLKPSQHLLRTAGC